MGSLFFFYQCKCTFTVIMIDIFKNSIKLNVGCIDLFNMPTISMFTDICEMDDDSENDENRMENCRHPEITEIAKTVTLNIPL